MYAGLNSSSVLKSFFKKNPRTTRREPATVPSRLLLYVSQKSRLPLVRAVSPFRHVNCDREA